MVKLLVILVVLFELANTLEVGFYKKSCPSAEAVIRRVVQEEVAKNHKNAAILLRLQFHDCFVEVRVIFCLSRFIFNSLEALLISTLT